MNVPAHIRYPAMIFALIGLTTVVNIILVVASRSDGGAQIMPDYYDQAVHWDEQEAIRQASRARGWSFRVQWSGNDDGILYLQDANAQPIEGFTATLHLRRPQFADDVAVATLTPIDQQPGAYRFDHPHAEEGWWDFVLDGEYEGQPFLLSERKRMR